MPPSITVSFKSWIKANTNMKLSSDADVPRVTYEGITHFKSLDDFNKKSIEYLYLICKENILSIVEDVAIGITAKPEILGSNISFISFRRLIVAANAAKYYNSIERNMPSTSMHYEKVISSFKV